MATLRAGHGGAETSATTRTVASAARGIGGRIADGRRAAAVVVVAAVLARGREALVLAWPGIGISVEAVVAVAHVPRGATAAAEGGRARAETVAVQVRPATGVAPVRLVHGER